MLIREIFEQTPTTFSFEFFPPKTEKGEAALFSHIEELQALRPSFVSVTYGAGGSTRQKTRDIVDRIVSTTDITTMPHLTCVGQTAKDMDEILDAYGERGVHNILALRGDAPKGEDYDWTAGEFRYATDLMKRIKSWSDRNKHPFSIGVAGFPEGHPDTPNRASEMDHLKAKVDAGADFIVTQMCFDNRDLYDFRERCELAGINVPIVAGIMPIQSVSGMRRMSELALGMRFPAPLIRMLKRCDGTDESVARVGVHWATEQSRDLVDQEYRGIHFYTLNKSSATIDIYKTLGVQHSQQLVEEGGGQIL